MKVVFQAANGQHAQLLRLTEDHHRRLFQDCQYHAFYGVPKHYWDWHFNFIKWWWLRKFFAETPDGTVVLWLDADAFVEKWFDLDSVIPAGSDFAAVRSIHSIFNMGVFFWRNSPNSRRVLELMIMQGPPAWQSFEDGIAANRHLELLRPTALHTGFNHYCNAVGEKGPVLVRAFHAQGWLEQERGIRKCVGL